MKYFKNLAITFVLVILAAFINQNAVLTWGKFFVYNRTFRSSFEIIRPTFLLLWVPSIVVFTAFSIIVHFSTRDMKRYIGQILFGIFATIFVSFVIRRGIGLFNNASVIDYLYCIVDLLIPFIGTFLGVLIIKFINKTEQFSSGDSQGQGVLKKYR